MRRVLLMMAGMWAGTVGCNDVTVVAPHPCSGNLSISRIRVSRIDKVDLLVVLDDGPSMADRQAELARRLPELLRQITDPAKDPISGHAAQTVDVHVGILSASLGSAGTSVCTPSVGGAAKDGRAHLLPRTPETSCASITASPLHWVFDPARDPAATFSGADGLNALGEASSCVVRGAGTGGCAFAQPWEATYHFLIDPAPYAKAEVKCTFGPAGDACGNNDIVVEGIDDDLLAQRVAFLRADSFVAVILLSNQNDVSLHPAGKNWLPWAYAAGSMRPGWEACRDLADDLEPDSSGELTAKGCFSCFQDDKNAACKKPWEAADGDAFALRGFHQVQRFGFNFLWSRDRYVDAFTKPTVRGSDGRTAPNPLFSGGFRDTSLVLVTGIVGVPKSLVESDGKPRPLSATDWEKLASPELGKRDPHMVESIAPRAGVARFVGDRTVDLVHGGDREVPGADDLQYACIAPRATPGASCDPATDPLCGATGKQTYTKAYPGLRHLRILEKLGPSGLVASICTESFGPTMTAVAQRIRAVASQQCIRTAMPTAGDGVNCSLFEVLPDVPPGKTCESLTGLGSETGYCTPGSSRCRREGDLMGRTDKASAALQSTFVVNVGATTEIVQGFVDGDNVVVQGSDGKKRLVCELLQLRDRVDAAAASACRSDPSYAPAGGGYCYSSDPAMIGDVCLRSGATSTLRFVGDVQPKVGSEIFPVCGKC